MGTLVHRFSTMVAVDGLPYAAEVRGDRREDGMWEGRLMFLGGDGTVLVTGRETTQNSLAALTYWATGLEPVYLEGALERARPLSGSLDADVA